MNIANLNTARMSTKEIAALTDKRHSDVLDENIHYKSFVVKNLPNGMTQEILLDKDLTICLVAGGTV